jgi:hypothetical protein
MVLLLGGECVTNHPKIPAEPPTIQTPLRGPQARTHADACMHACMYVCMYVCMHASTYLCMYVCMYVCICVYQYMCIFLCVCENAYISCRPSPCVQRACEHYLYVK